MLSTSHRSGRCSGMSCPSVLTIQGQPGCQGHGTADCWPWPGRSPERHSRLASEATQKVTAWHAASKGTHMQLPIRLPEQVLLCCTERSPCPTPPAHASATCWLPTWRSPGWPTQTCRWPRRGVTSQQEVGGGHSSPSKDRTLQGTGSGRKRCMQPRRCEAAHCVICHREGDTQAAEWWLWSQSTGPILSRMGQRTESLEWLPLTATACARAALQQRAALQVG